MCVYVVETNALVESENTPLEYKINMRAVKLCFRFAAAPAPGFFLEFWGNLK